LFVFIDITFYTDNLQEHSLKDKNYNYVLVTLPVILDTGDRSRRPTLLLWKKRTATTRLEANLQLDEEASEEATSTFL